MKAWGIAAVLVAMMAGCVREPDHGQVVARVDGDRHVTIRAEAGKLWWSHWPWSEPHPLWQLPAAGNVENVAVTPNLSSDDGFIVTFEQGGVRWRGEIGDDRVVATDLSRLTESVKLNESARAAN